VLSVKDCCETPSPIIFPSGGELTASGRRAGRTRPKSATPLDVPHRMYCNTIFRSLLYATERLFLELRDMCNGSDSSHLSMSVVKSCIQSLVNMLHKGIRDVRRATDLHNLRWHTIQAGFQNDMTGILYNSILCLNLMIGCVSL
jgi:hypothetical protein